MKKQKDNSQPPTLKDLRKRLGKSQSELADILGVKQQAVSLWESGQRMPSLDNAVKLAKAFGVTLNELCLSMGIDIAGMPIDE